MSIEAILVEIVGRDMAQLVDIWLDEIYRQRHKLSTAAITFQKEYEKNVRVCSYSKSDSNISIGYTIIIKGNMHVYSYYNYRFLNRKRELATYKGFSISYETRIHSCFQEYNPEVFLPPNY
jgi:hypothetical protein